MDSGLTPPDLAVALAEAGAADHWESAPPSHRREYPEWIEEAVKAETRERRVARTIAMVMEAQMP